MDAQQREPGFFLLPKEIRFMIYESVLKDSVIKVGNDQINSKLLTEWPQQPGICRACRLLRCETMDVYFSFATVQLNVQRPTGERMAISWISAVTSGSPAALDKLRNVSIIAGLGYNDPPKEYRVDMQQCTLVSALRPCISAYLYNYRGTIRSWSFLASGALKRRLRCMPGRHHPKFNIAENLREVLATVGELSGYGLDAAWIRSVSPSTMRTTLIQESFRESDSLLLALPRELRLIIYEYTFSTDTEVVIGERDLRNQLLTDGPPSPGLLRTSSFIRSEALSVYFACTHFVLNVQRILCEAGVLEWIQRCSRTYPDAFRHINVVSVIAGSGIRQPPQQYKFRLQKNEVLSVKNRPTFSPYTLAAHLWDPPLLESVGERLQQMPKKREPGFDIVRNLREIMDVLAK